MKIKFAFFRGSTMQSPVRQKTSGILVFFSIFGLSVVDVRDRATREFFLLISNQVNIIAELILLYLCYSNAHGMFDFSHTIGLIVDVLQIVAAIVTHLICLVECLHERRRIKQIWMDILLLIHLGGSSLKKTLRGRFRSYIGLVISSFGVCTGIEIWIMVRAAKIWFRSRAVGHWPFMACRAAFLFYLLHVMLMGSGMQMVAEELRYAASASKCQLKSKRVEMEKKNLLRIVKHCRKCYGLIYRISLDLSDCFGWSLIANLLYNFMDITIALYYNYRRIYLNMLNAGEWLVRNDGDIDSFIFLHLQLLFSFGCHCFLPY